MAETGHSYRLSIFFLDEDKMSAFYFFLAEDRMSAGLILRLNARDYTRDLEVPKKTNIDDNCEQYS